MKNFASDNYTGIHPKIMKAMQDANQGVSRAYGEDTYTKEAEELFRQHFGKEAEVFFVCNGTSANVLGIYSQLKSYEAVICADTAHINVDECGAAEKFLGSKLLTIPSPDGKLTVPAIKNFLSLKGDQHKVQPKIISITQCTECATVYTQKEILEITRFAKENQLLVHMDGARLSNAAAFLNTDLISLTKDAGIDILSFGGTKNGMMLGEAVVFFNKEQAKDFPYIRKQGMQLVSKMRFISAQFIALLSDGLWLKNAKHANAQAQLLAAELKKIPQIKINKEIQANAVFASLDRRLISKLLEQYYFYVWDEAASEVRWMTSWDTTNEDIFEFVSSVKQVIASQQKG